MGFEGENETSATPKLSLSKLPTKQTVSLIMSTPPLSSSVSIPFRWEEAPGKPRAHSLPSPAPAKKNKSSAARCLDLPPRLLNIANVDPKLPTCVSSSPTTVLDGPYNVGRSLRVLEEEGIVSEEKCRRYSGKTGVIDKERYPSLNLAFRRRRGSYRENTGDLAGDSFEFTTSVGESRAIAKPPRLKRRSSLFNFSHAGSNLLAGFYGGLKQVVPWRRKDENKRKI